MKKTSKLMCLALAAFAAVVSLSGCSAAQQVRDGVNSVVDRANTFEYENDAAALDNAVRTFYAKVVSGELNATTGANRVSAPLPPQNASVAERKARAAELTVYSVLEEQGMTNRFTEEYLRYFVCCENSICYVYSDKVQGKYNFPIDDYTMIGNILYS